MFDLGRWIVGKVCQGHRIFRDESQWMTLAQQQDQEKRKEDKIRKNRRSDLSPVLCVTLL